MQLDNLNESQAAKAIVDIAVAKLEAVLDDYMERNGSKDLTLPDVRRLFLKHARDEPRLRTLTTTFVSFLVEWDYRLTMIDLSKAASREPFFTHLFKGCLLFESLIKASVKGEKYKEKTLGRLLKEPCILQALGIDAVCASKGTFEEIIQVLKPTEPIREAIKCTLSTRNRLGHNLDLDVKSLNGEKYGQLACNIAASCLHAISRLYR